MPDKDDVVRVNPAAPQDQTGTTVDLTGTTVGRFNILARLGSGGMGEVYRAEDTVLRRAVAIKRMAPRRKGDPAEATRILREGQRASSLNHPNIAGIYDVIEEKGEILLVMEYIAGKTLRERMMSPISLAEFLSIGIQCAEGLAAAHDQRIVHGDVKPENIMLAVGQRVKILDFGIARRLVGSDPSEATQSLASMTISTSGTPGYMAPEVLQQRAYDGRADLFSLGLVFYEMLGGRHPFQTDSFAGTVGRVLHYEPPSLLEINRDVPAPLAGVVEHMLAKDPAQRYPTAHDLLADLRAVERGDKPTYGGLSSQPRQRSQGRRFDWKSALIAAGAAALVVAVAFFIWGRNRHPANPQLASTSEQLPQNISLAILPLPVPEGDPEFAALANGVVATLAAKLTQLGENHSVQIVPASEMRSKHVTTLAEARQEFGVNLGLRVDIQRSGDLVRVASSLLDATTGHVLAAQSFDAPMSDPFKVEDEVANAAAAALGVALRPEERRALVSHGTNLPEAYNFYLQARGYLDDPFKPENASSAIALLNQALKLDSNYGTAQAELGMAYWWKYYSTKDKHLVVSAKEACAKAVESGTAGAEGHICLGVVANGTGEHEAAAAEFQKAVQLDPTNDRAYTGLALAERRLNKLEEAEKTYKQVIQLRPQYAGGYLDLGALYLQEQQVEKAIEAFSRAIAVAPDSYRGYSNLGAAYLYQAKYIEAIRPFEQSIAIRPTFAAYNNVGTAYLRLRRFPDAVRAYQAGLKLDESQYAVWGSLGDAQHFNGDQASARKAYEKAVSIATKQLEVNPKDAEVNGDIADYFAMLGERKQALKFLDQSLRSGQGDKDILLNAAVVYQDLGERSVAIEWLKKSLDAGVSSATVLGNPTFDSLKREPRFQMLVKDRTR
jgi:serine/threonine protein kinase/tetratricopeptide (TPR) repeat protein